MTTQCVIGQHAVLTMEIKNRKFISHNQDILLAVGKRDGECLRISAAVPNFVDQTASSSFQASKEEQPRPLYFHSMVRRSYDNDKSISTNV